jgi:DNA-binding MarR family transcriptional regulator
MSKRSGEANLPEAGEGKRGEAGHLGYLLRQAAGAFRHQMERALADLSVTPPQFAVMTMLNAYPGASNADLARLALLTPQTVSVIIANLDRAGSIRKVPHSVHGRILQIELTEAGRELLGACRERVAGLERGLAAGMSAAEEAVIRAWLVRAARG